MSNNDWEDKVGELVRDFTQVGSIPKSEGKRRINELIEAAREEGEKKAWNTATPEWQAFLSSFKTECRLQAIQDCIEKLRGMGKEWTVAPLVGGISNESMARNQALESAISELEEMIKKYENITK
jgi:hypothetical protein